MSEHSTSVPLFEQSQPVELSLYDQIKAGLVKVSKYSSPEIRFWVKVDKCGPIHPVCGQCWTWTGFKNGSGYGIIIPQDKRRCRAHRLSWEIHNGAISEDICVLHRCDNRSCVNPAHLFLGDRTDNAADRVAKGRTARCTVSRNAGEANPSAKLTSQEVTEIRRRYRPRCRINGGAALGRMFGVNQSVISALVCGRSWRCLE